MCTEDRKPARKTCMKCEISMCGQHLQARLTTPVFLQMHPLTEPMALCGSTKCPQHGKRLEYYCLDDLTCVCVSCAIEEQLNVGDRLQAVGSGVENVSLEEWEKGEREEVVRSGMLLVEAVTLLRDAALTDVQSSVSARMQSIKTSKSSMQAAQKEEDTFRFLQMYSQVFRDVEKAKAVDLRRGLEPGSERDKLLQEMRQNGEKMVKQAGDLRDRPVYGLCCEGNRLSALATAWEEGRDPVNLSEGPFSKRRHSRRTPHRVFSMANTHQGGP
ncbi:uncharacterized protein ACO6RY_03279 [Pungitius sinensis]